MGVLSVLLIIELIILGLLGILELVGMMIVRGAEEQDPIFVFCSTFWREFLWPPADMPARGGASSSRGGRSSGPSPRQVTDDDETYGRIMKNAEGTIDKCELMVLIEPHSPTDEVVGRDGDGLRIRVAGEPAESRTNKALIEMVATAVGVKPYQVTLTKGHYQTRKTVQIQGMTAEEVQAKLELMNEA
jgi:uncharacterized protein YggU (UPF0235/DUF167 family)